MSKGSRNIPRYTKRFPHGGYGATPANYRDAIDIEDAAHAINQINARKRRDGVEQRRQERAKAVTLAGGDALAAWLRKEVP